MLSRHGNKPRISNYIKKFISWRWLCIILFFTVTFSTIDSAQITINPIPVPIVKSGLAVGLQEIVKIPDSGSADQPSAQLNLLATANDGSGRLFVNMGHRLLEIFKANNQGGLDRDDSLCYSFRRYKYIKSFIKAERQKMFSNYFYFYFWYRAVHWE